MGQMKQKRVLTRAENRSPVEAHDERLGIECKPGDGAQHAWACGSANRVVYHIRPSRWMGRKQLA